MDVIEYEGVTRRLTDKLRTPILEAFSELFDEFGSKSRLRPYLPSAKESRICPICMRNHEATEFAFALILAAVDPFITESKEFRGLLIERGYAH